MFGKLPHVLLLVEEARHVLVGVYIVVRDCDKADEVMSGRSGLDKWKA